MSTRTGNVKVAFRVRPAASHDTSCAIHIDDQLCQVSIHDATNDKSVVHRFTFDRVFNQEVGQSKIYDETVGSLVPDFMAGRNCCVFVYGQTGSGKTYTILGPNQFGNGEPANGHLDESSQVVDGDDFSSLGSAGISRAKGLPGRADYNLAMLPPGQILTRRGEQGISLNNNELRRLSENSDVTDTGRSISQVDENCGITPRIVHDMFNVFRRRRRRTSSLSAHDEPTLRFSLVEIYGERVFDLLSTSSQRNADSDDISLTVRSSGDQGMVLEDATEINCSRESHVLNAVGNAQRILQERVRRSAIAENASHLILILKLERYSKSRGKRSTSNFFVVDLANSALVKKPPHDARPEVVEECRSVRRSLGALRKCIRCLSGVQKSSPPYGESVLTKVLFNGLQRGSGISFIVTANPESKHLQESLSAIRFGIYVADQRSEEAENSTINSCADGSLISRPHSPESKTSSDAVTASKYTETQGLRSPPREGAETERHSFSQNPETRSTAFASDPMSIIAEFSPSIEKLKNGPNFGNGRIGPNDTDQKELSQLSSLLNEATLLNENNPDATYTELAHAGLHESLSTEEIRLQLDTVAKDLERIECESDLESQIQTELQAARSALKRISLCSQASSQVSSVAEPNWRPSYSIGQSRDSECIDEEHSLAYSGTVGSTINGSRLQQGPSLHAYLAHGATSESERLRAELAELKNAYQMLQEQGASKSKELANARQEIQELKSEIENLQTEPGDHDEGNEVSNHITCQEGFPQIEYGADDWDENRVEVGPSTICVCLRLRPMTKLERNRRSRGCIEVHEGGREFTVDSPLDGEYDFCFDHVFGTESTQEEVYDTVGAPIVDDLLGGVNCAVMVYGLAGSGKTHTLAGKLPEMPKDESLDDETSGDESQSSDGPPTEQDAGFSPRLVADLFRGMKDSENTIEFRISCSYVCIYLEKVFDLLDPRFDKTLIVRDSPNGIHIEGAVEAFCFVEEDIIHLFRRGAACRKLIGNKLSIDSGRSHSIVTLKIEQHHIHSRRVRRSYLQLIELAGFEVTSKAKGQSVQETKIIHKSFSALGNVVKSLSEGNSYAPYRESKLTSIVKEALGGNCKTTLFITASPSSYHISETINSIRLGQRVRRVTNNPRVNIDVNVDHYRSWLLHSEMRLKELSSFVMQMAGELTEGNAKGLFVKEAFSSDTWKAIQALVDEEESKSNPCRKALILDEDNFMEPDEKKWRALTIELARRLPSEKLLHVMNERDRALSMLSDIQSECVVLRRQNELLVAEERKFEEKLSSSYRENKELTLQVNELTHQRQLAENRAKDALLFLRYMRTLCWKLKKDVEFDRPIDINDITDFLQGAPDLTGLVDLEVMMMESGIIHSKDVEIERLEDEYFDYLQRTGLLIDEEQVAAEDEVDELAFLDESLSPGVSDSRWRKAQTGRFDRAPERSGSSADESRQLVSQETFLGLSMPWLVSKQQDQSRAQTSFAQDHHRVRNTRKERELHRDLQNMANKCVELQLELNHLRQFMFSLTNKSTSLKMKNLTQECIQLAKDRDRVVHNVKAATWKLHELHVVNKLLLKQVTDAKAQIGFLEEGFQRLQETFRSSVQEALETDQSLRDRIRAMQSIIDSLTEPFQDQSCDSSSDGDSIGSANPLLDKIHLPLRGRRRSSQLLGPALVDPSGPLSVRHPLLSRYVGKRMKKRPSLMTHRPSKIMRRSFKFGTAIIGENRAKLKRAYDSGKNLVPPVFFEDDERSAEVDEETHYTEEYSHYRDGDDCTR